MLWRLLAALWAFVFAQYKPRLVFSEVRIDRSLVMKGNIMGLILPVDKRVDLSIQPQDIQGNPARIDGVPAWSASNENVSISVSEDGMSAVLVPLTLGTVQINVTADADLGEGIETIGGVLDVEVVGGKAVALTINTGPLVDA